MNISVLSVMNLTNLQKIFATIAVLAMVFSPFANVQLASAVGILGGGDVSLDQWGDAAPAGWQNGNLNDVGSNYSEGEVVPYRLTVKNSVSNDTYVISICRNYENGTKRGFLNLALFNTDRAATTGTISSTMGAVSGSNVTINSVTEVGGQGLCNTGDRETQVSFTKTGNSAALYWGGYLASPSEVGDGNSASQFPGGSLHMKLLSPSQDRSIQSSAIIPAIVGCTDPAAANYNPDASQDDGSCEYAPKLTVTKVVLNNSGTGSLGVVDFPLFVGQTSVTSGVENTFDAGAYVVSETGDAGYTASFSGDCDENGNITLANDGAYECTITNDDNAPDRATITVVKEVINDNGGTLEVVDFPLFVGATSVTSGVALEVFSAGDYTVSETNQFGYAAGDWGGDCAADGSLNGVVLGGSYTCTITNDDIAPSLTVIKDVQNDNINAAGDAVASDFIMNVTGTNVSDASFEGSETGVSVTLDAGAYSVEEGDHDGYSVEYSEDCSGTIGVGEELTCTVTNNDLSPTSAFVTFIKEVVNAFGGDAEPSDFSFNLTTIIDAIIPGNGVALGEGVYTLTENLPDNGEGYEVTYEGACPNGTVTIDSDDLGTNLECTVINTELPECSNGLNDDGREDELEDYPADPGCDDEDDDDESDPVGSLTVIKRAIGEQANADQVFDFSVTGQADFELASSSEPKTFIDLDDGAYTITESEELSRWELVDAQCYSDYGTNDEETETDTDQDSENNSVTVNLGIGEDVTCIFTNEYTPRDSGSNEETITIRKEVTDGSDLNESFAFDVSWLGDGIEDQDVVLTPNTESESDDLSADEWYQIEEVNLPSGWNLDDVFCSSNLHSEKDFSMDEGENDMEIFLEDGEHITCTFTNDQDRYEVSGQVWHDADQDTVIDEGESILAGWIVRITNGEGTNLFTETDAEGFYHFNLPEGTWTITEDVQGGWDQTSPVANSGAHIVTFPEEEVEMTLLDSMFDFLLPTAHAAVIGGVSGLNFGNIPQPSYSQGSYGGGNGRRVELSDGGGDRDDEPEGEVLGEATSTLPVGAPNTGNGGSAVSLDLHTVVAILASRRSVRATHGN
jgi:hypothetical protein